MAVELQPNAGSVSKSGTGAELRLLLIEDNELLRTRLISILTVPGVMRVVDDADTQQSAIEKIERNEYDALVVDVELRQGTGIPVIRRAREVNQGRSQPLIIVLTNYALPTVERRCMAAGADYFLDKMRQFHELTPLIEEWNGKRSH